MSHAQGAFRFGGRRQVHRPRYVQYAREADVLRACLELLAVLGIPAWRANTGASRMRNRDGAERFEQFGLKGQSDILGLIPPTGRMLAVETKARGRKTTSDQTAFLDAVNRAGGLGIVVYNVAELDAALRKEGRS